MPKLILEFDIPEEQTEAEDAFNGWRYSLALSNIQSFIRGKYKHGDYPEDAFKQVEEIYEYVCEEIRNSRMDN